MWSRRLQDFGLPTTRSRLLPATDEIPAFTEILPPSFHTLDTFHVQPIPLGSQHHWSCLVPFIDFFFCIPSHPRFLVQRVLNTKSAVYKVSVFTGSQNSLWAPARLSAASERRMWGGLYDEVGGFKSCATRSLTWVGIFSLWRWERTIHSSQIAHVTWASCYSQSLSFPTPLVLSLSNTRPDTLSV